MSGSKGLNRQQMADLIAHQFQDGWVVNLGVGIPTMASNTDIGDRDILYHSENGVIGYGAVADPGTEDLNLVNAGGQNVTLKPGAAPTSPSPARNRPFTRRCLRRGSPANPSPNSRPPGIVPSACCARWPSV